jgi:hypothetical protein
LGRGVEVKHKKVGCGDADKQNKGTLTPRGEEQVAYLVFCNIASSVPRSDWEGERGMLFNKRLS